jgi:hypothetical protein
VELEELQRKILDDIAEYNVALDLLRSHCVLPSVRSYLMTVLSPLVVDVRLARTAKRALRIAVHLIMVGVMKKLAGDITGRGSGDIDTIKLLRAGDNGVILTMPTAIEYKAKYEAA